MTNQTSVSCFRRAIERFSRPILLRRRLPAEFGSRPIYLSPANRLRALVPDLRRFEPDLFDYARRFVKPGSAVWDIGANMGAFALPAAHGAGPLGTVVAIEPDPFNQMLLQRSRQHRRNRDLRLTVVAAAVSDKVGMAELEIAERGRAANALRGAAHGTQMGGVRRSETVMTVTLDWLANHMPAPDLIKCDAEGAEVWILQGGAHVLEAIRPVLIMEVPRENAVHCTAILHGHGYVLFRAGVPIDPTAALDAIGEAWEICAIPSERVMQWAGR